AFSAVEFRFFEGLGCACSTKDPAVGVISYGDCSNVINEVGSIFTKHLELSTAKSAPLNARSADGVRNHFSGDSSPPICECQVANRRGNIGAARRVVKVGCLHRPRWHKQLTGPNNRCERLELVQHWGKGPTRPHRYSFLAERLAPT